MAEALAGVTVQRGTETRNKELRVRLIGKTGAGQVLFIVVTFLDTGVVRAVTAFPANRAMRRLYAEYTGALP